MKDSWIRVKSQECSGFIQPEILLSLSYHSDLFLFNQSFPANLKVKLKYKKQKRKKEKRQRRKFSIVSTTRDIVSEIVKLLPFFGVFLMTSWNSLKWSGIEL